MPITINANQFRNIASNQPDSARVFLKRNSLGSGTGFIQWIKGRALASDNRLVTGKFIDSLKQTYGEDIASHVSESTDLNQALAKGKPLKSRHVTAAFKMADQLQKDFQTANKTSVQNINRPLSQNNNNTLLDVRLEGVAKKYLGANCDVEQVKQSLDMESIHSVISDIARIRGQKGKHLVTEQDIAEISEAKIRSSLRKSEHHNAIARMGSPAQNNSIAAESLKRVSAQAGFPIDPGKLTPAAAESLQQKLNNRLEEAVAYIMDNIDSSDSSAKIPEALSNEKLQTLADKVVQKFVQKRIEAHQAVQALPPKGAVQDGIDSHALHKQLASHVLHDSLDADFIPTLGSNYTAMRDAVQQLKTALTPGNEATHKEDFTKALKTMNAVIRDTTNATDEISSDKRPEALRSFWQFLLQDTSPEDKAQLLESMKRTDGDFMKLVQGLQYARTEMANCKEFFHGDAMDKYSNTIAQASEAAQIFLALTEALGESTQAGEGSGFDVPHIAEAGKIPAEQIQIVDQSLGIKIPVLTPMDE